MLFFRLVVAIAVVGVTICFVRRRARMGEDNNQGYLNPGFYNPRPNNLYGNNPPPNNAPPNNLPANFVVNRAFDNNNQVIQNEGAEQPEGNDYNRRSAMNSMRLHNN